jgi:hypothetical protein
VQAATNVESLSDEGVLDAQFLRELVAFGFEYAKLNPTVLTTATETGTEAFLATLWQGEFTEAESVAMRQATGKLSELFKTLDTKEQRVKLLEFEKQLFKVAKQLPPHLQLSSQDAKWLSGLAEWSSAYAALKPDSFNDAHQPSNFFWQTIWTAQTPEELQKGADQLAQFLDAPVTPNALQFYRHVTVLINHLQYLIDDIGVEFTAAVHKLASVYASLNSSLSSASHQTSNFFLNRLWQDLHTAGEVIDLLDIVDAGQKFLDFVGEVRNAGTAAITELIDYSARALETLAQVPALADNSGNDRFIEQFLDLVRLHFQVVSANERPESNGFLSTIWNADTPEALSLAANQFQSKIEALTESGNAIAQSPSTLNVSQSVTLTGLDVDSLIQALTTGDDPSHLLEQYIIYDVSLAYEANLGDSSAPAGSYLALTTTDENLSIDELYDVGHQFDHRTIEGDTYPYALVLHEGQLTYYPEGVNYTLHPGDKVLYSAASDSQFPLALLQNYIAENVVEPLLDFNVALGQFVLGAIYQFSVNQSEPLTTLLSLNPEVKQWFENAEAGAEAVLPDTVAFQAGRLLGDGAAIVVGILEIIRGIRIGVGGTGAGSTLCLTGVGCIAGAPAMAVSVAAGAALVVQGAGTFEAGVEGAIERIATLMAITGGGSGSAPLPGDPVPGIQGAIFGKSRNNSANQANIDYEVRVTEKNADEADLAVFVDRPPGESGPPVEFDWFDGTTLLDAKNYTLDNPLVDLSKPQVVRDGVRSDLVEAARRQLRALSQSSATGIEWRVATDEARQAIIEIFADEGITGINVVWYP